ncbi:sigma 54-interacting transcriptional regulator [Acidocella aromatica]|uniref:HTH-type transcriptional regulatory protein TyrR n=1 Tax=Acidocella aromatica TaxID=1303579 RepID=A0A840VBJ1_9PROT|nr:sigma 54-interacting transcriptional regulator [Acidocella aromatica]MBB5373076.1 transcriptional regulator with PAS, ATPase and Fis domain [Acidocella aromatica]
MIRPTEISPFRLGIRGQEAVSDETLAALFALPAFRIVAAALPDPLLAVDSDENILFLNAAMAQLSGIPAASAERLPLANFLRRAGFRLEENPEDEGRTDGLARLVSTADGRFLPVQRRVLASGELARGYRLYIVRPGETPVLPRRASRAAPRADAPELALPPGLKEQVQRATRAYRRGVRILLLGESGVGKTVIARHVHDLAAGKEAPFVHVNCGSIPETLFESEMFGYERGAFTGALQAGKRGFVEAARGGTLFLDEVGEIPLSSQAKLLKFLEDSTIQPVGSPVSKRIETTVITATNRDLREMIAQGRFREDLFYRIATFPMLVPSLRDRPDKEALLDALLAKVNVGRQPQLRLAPDCRAALLAAHLPGNVRELSGIIDYLDIVADEVAMPKHLETVLSVAGAPPAVPFLQAEGTTLKEMTAVFEDQVLRDAIARYGSKREAAQHLGIDNATLIRKLRRLPGQGLAG